MSETEQFEIVGRAHASLKESRARIAAINLRLNEYSKDLTDTSEMLRRFIANPLYENPAMLQIGMARAGNLKTLLSKAQGAHVVELIDELISEAEGSLELQRQIDNA